MMTVVQIAVGVALAPVVFAIGLLTLRGILLAIQELPYLWTDHPNISIALCCGALALFLATR